MNYKYIPNMEIDLTGKKYLTIFDNVEITELRCDNNQIESLPSEITN